MSTQIPPATISRLLVYLRCLDDVSAAGTHTFSSDQLAEIAGVNPAQVRKDLSYLGSHGVRGVGYRVDDLRKQIGEALGVTRDHSVVIVGAGRLGTALSNFGGFADWGFDIAAVVDNDPEKVGRKVRGTLVESLDDLEAIVEDRNVLIGIIATPAAAAQAVADRLGEVGVRSILNFAPTVLRIPDGVRVRRVDLSTELQILAFHLDNEP